MSENFMRHFIAFIGSLICVAAYWAGYVGGKSGIWWPIFGVIAIYAVIYKLIET